MNYVIKIVEGQKIKIFPPSKKKAHAKIKSYKVTAKTAANFVAKERGLIIDKYV